ncbi:MAG: hypothetical protein GY928_01555 [Colwellia sp.]|nr:hypothetical protein [Colwellia sp.]
MIKLFPTMSLASLKTFCQVTLLLILLIAAVLAQPTLAKSPQGNKWHEADFVDAHCEGEVEFVLADRTRVDCLTNTHAIEYDWGKKWAESLGQALFYSAMTGKKAGIVLIVNPKTKDRYLKRLNKAISDNNLAVDVWTIKQRKS